MFRFSLITPEEIFFQGEVCSVVSPGTVGYFEVLSNHAAIISTLRKGKVTITDENKKTIFCTITGGYFEMLNNEAVLLADSVTIIPQDSV